MQIQKTTNISINLKTDKGELSFSITEEEAKSLLKALDDLLNESKVGEIRKEIPFEKNPIKPYPWLEPTIPAYPQTPLHPPNWPTWPPITCSAKDYTYAEKPTNMGI